MLEGVRVLDLSRLLPGPFCTMLLADLGAEVIKIEDPRGGDYARYYPPMAPDSDHGTFFASINRNKKSVSLNLKDPDDVALLKRLVKTADVLIESFRPDVMRRLGLDYETLKAINPKLVFCSLTGYGQTGPRRTDAGHDLNFVALAGLAELNGRSCENPVVPPIQVGDFGGALFAAVGIVSGLFKAERTSKGSFIDVSMTESAMSLLTPLIAQNRYHPVEKGKTILGGGIPGYDLYETADKRFLAVAPVEEKFWAQFIATVDKPEWAGKNLSLGEEGDSLRLEIAALISTKPLQDWVDLLKDVDACIEPALTIEELESEPQFVERGIFFELMGVQHLKTPISTIETHCRPPELGEHNDEILNALKSEKAG